jgi:hypothetical protein
LFAHAEFSNWVIVGMGAKKKQPVVSNQEVGVQNEAVKAMSKSAAKFL